LDSQVMLGNQVVVDVVEQVESEDKEIAEMME
jgi:hypothetical protein